MFSKNELIIYNNEGVCRVDDICPLKEMTNSDRLYYKLSPIYGKGSIFIPCLLYTSKSMFKYFSQSLERELTSEEKAIIKTAYKLGRNNTYDL